MKIPGIMVAPFTPFTPDLKVDYKALEKEIDYVVEVCKADAIGTLVVESQEYQFLPHEERKELMRRTAEFTAGRCPVIVGATHPSYQIALELCHFAAELGAEAVEILAPARPFGYGAPSRDDILRYFEAIARECPLPIVLYHNPGPGAELPPPLMVELAKMDKVQYFKESSRDLRRVALLIDQIDRPGYAHFFTTMEMLLMTLLLGGPGAEMPAPAAVIGHEIVEAFAAGDIPRAVAAQRKFSLFPAKWAAWGLPPVMKAAMKFVGVDLGAPFPPYQPLPPKETAELKAYLEQIGLI